MSLVGLGIPIRSGHLRRTGQDLDLVAIHGNVFRPVKTTFQILSFLVPESTIVLFCARIQIRTNAIRIITITGTVKILDMIPVHYNR